MVIRLICFFGGFLFLSILDMIVVEFNEWLILGVGLIVVSVEVINSFYYFILKKFLLLVRNFGLINDLKLGVFYGLIVDVFKFGS